MGRTEQTEIHSPSASDLDPGFAAFRTVSGDVASGWLLVCDHAKNTLPARYGTLGLPDTELSRHIGYDIGAEGVTERMAARLHAPAVLSGFSRLLIDPNRGEDDPTLVMRLSDGSIVPGNAHADDAETTYRLNRFYRPYDHAITAAIDQAVAADVPPLIVSIHSFTADWRGSPRPWHVGVLWDRDARLAQPLIDALRQDPELVVGDNEPYTGALTGDTMYRHGTRRGIAHALIEIRQDLISDDAGMDHWAGLLTDILARLGEATSRQVLPPSASDRESLVQEERACPT